MAYNKKVLIYVGLSVIVLTGGFLIYKYFKKGSEGKITPVPEPLPKPENEIESGLFPLRKGSYNNKYVKMLQSALGVTADGDFGPITYDALKSKTGKVQISNYDDLMATIASLKSVASAASEANRSLSTRLLQDYKSKLPFGYSNIVLISDTVAKEVAAKPLSLDFDFTGVYVLELTAGDKLPLSNYQLHAVAKNGDLIIYCKAGTNQGYWQINPQSIELK
jgi:hypothetical protein